MIDKMSPKMDKDDPRFVVALEAAAKVYHARFWNKNTEDEIWESVPELRKEVIRRLTEPIVEAVLATLEEPAVVVKPASPMVYECTCGCKERVYRRYPDAIAAHEADLDEAARLKGVKPNPGLLPDPVPHTGYTPNSGTANKHPRIGW